jgi:hypothetical protein
MLTPTTLITQAVESLALTMISVSSSKGGTGGIDSLNYKAKLPISAWQLQ